MIGMIERKEIHVRVWERDGSLRRDDSLRRDGHLRRDDSLRGDGWHFETRSMSIDSPEQLNGKSFIQRWIRGNFPSQSQSQSRVPHISFRRKASTTASTKTPSLSSSSQQAIAYAFSLRWQFWQTPFAVLPPQTGSIHQEPRRPSARPRQPAPAA